MSFNIQVARAMVRGYNEEVSDYHKAHTSPREPRARLEPPAPGEGDFYAWFEHYNQPDEGYDPRKAPLVVMSVKAWDQARDEPGSWDPQRAFYLVLRGVGINVTEDQTDALIGALHECWQGYSWLSYGAEYFDEHFPPPAEPAPTRAYAEAARGLCGVAPVGGTLKGLLSCKLPAKDPHADGMHHDGEYNWPAQ